MRPTSLAPRFAAIGLSALAAAISILWIDAPVAGWMGATYHATQLEQLFGGSVLVAAEALFIVLLLVIAVSHRRSRQLSRMLMIAGGISIMAYGINQILKIIFGRLTPLAAAQLHVADRFIFWHGDSHSSFPSGHMALTGALFGVLGHAYPRSRRFLLALLFAIGAVLVIGNWHYVSDVIAGGVLGLAMGWAAGGFAAKQAPLRTL